MIRKGLILSAVLGAGLLIFGCAGDSSSGSSSSAARGGAGRSGAPAASGAARNSGGAALFRLPAPDGQTVTVKTPAALFFFTSWCGYCKQAMPELKQMTERARQMGWRVYGVNVNEGPAQANGFIQQYQPNFPVVLDQQGMVAEKYGVRGYPTFVVIDQNANIVYNGHAVPTHLVR